MARKKGGSLFTASSFDAMNEGSEEEVVDNSVEASCEGNDDMDEAVIAFTGKKKSSKSSKKAGALFIASSFGETDGAQDRSVQEDEDEDVAPIAFSGKKKKTSKSYKKDVNSFSAAFAVEDVDDDSVLESSRVDGDNVEDKSASNVVFSGKKKSSKKKSGRSAQEEEDLDKILAELGEGPLVKPAASSVDDGKVQSVSTEVAASSTPLMERGGEEETMESAAAKKKKKKREKEKQKKAAANIPDDERNEEAQQEISETKKNDSKTKRVEKKVPKHVREMQEALARRKEAEERVKRQEEERLRKEEEERRRQEEIERQAEETRRRRKEREKEKLQKKKQEGKLLTDKQKEEALRLEAMRKQFLAASGGITLPMEDSGAPAERPIYQTKKSKQTQHHHNGTTPTEYMEAKENMETTPAAESLEADKVEEDEVEDEDDWDARSWADVNFNGKSALADEEANSEPEPVVKKEINNPGPPAVVKSRGTTQEAASQRPTEIIESKRQVEKQPCKQDGLLTADSVVPSQPSERSLRSPICCILGHVDAGKTMLLDCMRGTNVQEGEAGGITQQIGATYFPAEEIRKRTKELKADAKLEVPGLLAIDTPGHESFINLRSRGSGLCDIAILVVDIMHGLKQQTIESLDLLKARNTEFIVALNKVDRLYGWKECPDLPIVKAMKKQTKDVQNEFKMRVAQIITQFKEQGLNTELYYKNKEMGETFSIVPTSAKSGEGIPDLLLLLVQWTQKTMAQKITYNDELQCIVLEVKVVEGHGTTIDVVLVNGVLHEGDQIVVCGTQEPIVTTIRSLLTPRPMKELRVKGTYLHHKEIKAAMGIKISAQGLEHAIAGTALYVMKPEDDLEGVKELVKDDMKQVMSRIDKSGDGIWVQASTLGSLEALLEHFKKPEVNIPVRGMSIGPVHKKDVNQASVMLEKKKREFATILAFDVKVNQEAKDLAEQQGVKIFMSDTIYHLSDQFKAYIDHIKEENKREAGAEAVLPCKLKILQNFNTKNPIILGVDVVEGVLKVGTPICIPSRGNIDIGRIASIRNNNVSVDCAKKGTHVSIQIDDRNSEEQKMYGRHFGDDDELVSHISRRSIDILKEYYRDELSKEEWKLVLNLKQKLDIK